MRSFFVKYLQSTPISLTIEFQNGVAFLHLFISFRRLHFFVRYRIVSPSVLWKKEKSIPLIREQPKSLVYQ
jgi:hypothetical protein